MTTTHTEPCRRCLGTGTFQPYGRCFACRGTGRLQPRASAVANVTQRSDLPQEVTDWLARDTGAFATSLNTYLNGHGYLTVRQVEAAARAARQAAPATEQPATAVNVQPIVQALTNARNGGLRRPKLRLNGFVFMFGRHFAGECIYVRHLETRRRAATIINGALQMDRRADDGWRDLIVQACVQPEQTAVSHGRMTGHCACCGRLLTDPESVTRGIGPVCARTFFAVPVRPHSVAYAPGDTVLWYRTAARNRMPGQNVQPQQEPLPQPRITPAVLRRDAEAAARARETVPTSITVEARLMHAQDGKQYAVASDLGLRAGQWPDRINDFAKRELNEEFGTYQDTTGNVLIVLND